MLSRAIFVPVDEILLEIVLRPIHQAIRAFPIRPHDLPFLATAIHRLGMIYSIGITTSLP